MDCDVGVTECVHFDTLGNDTVDVVFNYWGFRRTVTVEGDRIIFQIVTSAVRINVALTLSKWRSLFASPNLCSIECCKSMLLSM